MGLDLGALAKVQLHCHLEGTVRAETFRALAVKYGVPLGERADPARTYAFETFREFLLLFAKVTEALREPDDFGRIARDYVADAAAQGVLYAEIFISPSVWSFFHPCLLYTSDAADDLLCVDLGGRRIIKKKKKQKI